MTIPSLFGLTPLTAPLVTALLFVSPTNTHGTPRPAPGAGPGIVGARELDAGQDPQPAGDEDCLFVVDASTGMAVIVDREPRHIPHVDIMPGKCPNKFVVDDDDHDDEDDGGDDDAASMAMSSLRISVLGNAFDVTQVDITTVRLSRVAPQNALTTDALLAPYHIDFHDRGTPFEGTEPCGCNSLHGDGILDLNLRFHAQEVIDAFGLDSVPSGTQVPLRISGRIPGLGFRVTDCLLITREDDGHSARAPASTTTIR